MDWYLVIDAVSQGIIFILGLIAIILISCFKNRWGNVIGFLTQPFWYFTTWYHEQWGLLALSFIYTLVWGLGIYRWFFQNGQKES